MKKIYAFSLFMLFTATHAQVVKLSSGLMYSNVKINDMDLGSSKLSTAPILLGVDYFEQTNYYLSSEVGYLKIGNKGVATMAEIDPNGNVRDGDLQKETFDMIHLNTTIRYKLNFQTNAHAFIGAGPSMNILTNRDFKGEVYKDIAEMPKILMGVKTEIGFSYEIDRFRASLSGVYLPRFKQRNDLIKYGFDGISTMVSLGYRL